eukprot:8185844-Heterocapsa_arctica.AAC.1
MDTASVLSKVESVPAQTSGSGAKWEALIEPLSFQRPGVQALALALALAQALALSQIIDGHCHLHEVDNISSATRGRSSTKKQSRIPLTIIDSTITI